MVHLHIKITGIVQGVGFRPFLHRLSQRFGIVGTVCNTSDGLELDIECSSKVSDLFVREIKDSAPAFAVIENISVTKDNINAGFTDFRILESKDGTPNTLVSPDIGICEDCRRELLDPSDRHYRYPFINCTNCGPRFSIIRTVPYDRINTSMSSFPMCSECAKEYKDIGNRRYHAQPVACPACGPGLYFEIPSDNYNGTIQATDAAKPTADITDLYSDSHLASVRDKDSDKALYDARRLLFSGKVLAVKGIGGFHLSCLADDADAVIRLRDRKHREEKPLAVMCRDIDTVRKICNVTSDEEKILKSPRSPIVLLRKKDPASFDWLSKTPELGVMLPYTPLHVLLFEKTPYESEKPERTDKRDYSDSANEERELNAADDFNLVEHNRMSEQNRLTDYTNSDTSKTDTYRGNGFDMLVMTSANISDCPICTDNNEARQRLAGIADGFLFHDRDIVSPCDDSLVRIYDHKTYFIRRSRGYAPQPVIMGRDCDGIIALGSEQKASFALGRGNEVFISQHIGDLKNIETYDHYRNQISRFENLFGISPRYAVCDLHPDYMSTSYAENELKTLPLLKVQHHHAHMASCMADNGLDGTCIALTWDGTGLGSDNTIWGGECLVGDYNDFKRVCSIRPIKLAGGDTAVKEIRRIALALAVDSGIPESAYHLFHLTDANVHDRRNRNTDTCDVSASSILTDMITSGTGCMDSSGMGRLFDGIYSLLTGCGTVSYEGQGAVLLEALADPFLSESGSYTALKGIECPEPVFYTDAAGIYRLDTRELIRSLVSVMTKGIVMAVSLYAAIFHKYIARAGVMMCQRARELDPSLNRVVLSGGVFLNTHLLGLIVPELEACDFKVFTHKRVSTCDEGISLGQLAIAAHRITTK